MEDRQVEELERLVLGRLFGQVVTEQVKELSPYRGLKELFPCLKRKDTQAGRDVVAVQYVCEDQPKDEDKVAAAVKVFGDKPVLRKTE